ncbi:hypothetical protein VTI28DRAFT_8986 [Corynascus sepedonium]
MTPKRRSPPEGRPSFPQGLRPTTLAFLAAAPPGLNAAEDVGRSDPRGHFGPDQANPAELARECPSIVRPASAMALTIT